MSWFWRGFQSAVFYYVSCAPCTKLAYRRRQRKENLRTDAERTATETEQGPYRHPTPFSTNMYWKEEMLLGPGPPWKKSNKDKDKDKEKGKVENSRGLVSGGVGSSTNTGVSSADTVIGEDGGNSEVDQERRSGDGWNRRRYQREDEMLWGLDDDDGGSSSGMPENSRAGSGAGMYYIARNPAVNDLHPPVVSTQPTHRSETKWMLQPPPSAKIMEGKEKANRSRSGSQGSHGTNGSGKKTGDVSLGRKVGERLLEEKTKKGDRLPIGESASSSSKGPPKGSTNLAGHGQRHDRDLRPSSDSIRPSDDTSKRKRHSSPITIPEDLDAQSPIRKPSPVASSALLDPSLANSRVVRPPLSTIHSSTAPTPKLQKSPLPHLRPLLLSTSSNSSLHILQELVSPVNLSHLNTQPLAYRKEHRSGSPLPEARIKLPPVSEREARELRLPELESWFPLKEFRFPSNDIGEQKMATVGK